jgi:SAM-dependent methyltransferase
MKDNFSGRSDAYANFRPSYPPALAAAIAAQSPANHLVWDCATGNGQMAKLLANHFQQVIATDISANQLALATQLPNIEYRQESSHQSTLLDHSVDAVVIAQAIHWFDFDVFYKEVRRVVRPGGIIAVVGYPLLEPRHPAIQNALLHFYSITIGPYWDNERHFLDEEYETIPFPFEELPFDEQYMLYQWDIETMIGFLNSWSAVQHYIDKNGNNPVTAFEEELRMVWPQGEKVGISFKIVGRMGRV